MTKNNSQNVTGGYSPFAHISNEEYGAYLKIRIALKVPVFVAELQRIRPTAGRQLFYDSYSDRRTDSPLLQWVRSMAIQYASTLDIGTSKKDTADEPMSTSLVD